jgi:hypothetical protein
MTSYEVIWGRMRSYGLMWGHTRPYKAIWGYASPCGDIWGHVIWGYLRSSGVIWGRWSSYKVTWSHARSYKVTWGWYEVFRGHMRSCLKRSISWGEEVDYIFWDFFDGQIFSCCVQIWSCWVQKPFPSAGGASKVRSHEVIGKYGDI